MRASQFLNPPPLISRYLLRPRGRAQSAGLHAAAACSRRQNVHQYLRILLRSMPRSRSLCWSCMLRQSSLKQTRLDANKASATHASSSETEYPSCRHLGGLSHRQARGENCTAGPKLSLLIGKAFAKPTTVATSGYPRALGIQTLGSVCLRRKALKMPLSQPGTDWP